MPRPSYNLYTTTAADPTPLDPVTPRSTRHRQAFHTRSSQYDTRFAPLIRCGSAEGPSAVREPSGIGYSDRSMICAPLGRGSGTGREVCEIHRCTADAGNPPQDTCVMNACARLCRVWLLALRDASPGRVLAGVLVSRHSSGVCVGCAVHAPVLSKERCEASLGLLAPCLLGSAPPSTPARKGVQGGIQGRQATGPSLAYELSLKRGSLCGLLCGELARQGRNCQSRASVGWRRCGAWQVGDVWRGG